MFLRPQPEQKRQLGSWFFGFAFLHFIFISLAGLFLFFSFFFALLFHLLISLSLSLPLVFLRFCISVFLSPYSRSEGLVQVPDEPRIDPDHDYS